MGRGQAGSAHSWLLTGPGGCPAWRHGSAGPLGAGQAVLPLPLLGSLATPSCLHRRICSPWPALQAPGSAGLPQAASLGSAGLPHAASPGSAGLPCTANPSSAGLPRAAGPGSATPLPHAAGPGSAAHPLHCWPHLCQAFPPLLRLARLQLGLGLPRALTSVLAAFRILLIY